MKYLFLCSAGEDRSPTAVGVAKRLAEEKGLKIEASFRRFRDFLDFPNYDVLSYLNNFDKVFVMQEEMRRLILERGYDSKRVFCLNIPDGPSFGEEQLISDLELALKKLI